MRWSQRATNRANVFGVRRGGPVGEPTDAARTKQEAKLKKSEKTELARRSAARKLAPEAITTSTFVRSLLGYLLDEIWTFPHVHFLACDSDGTLLVWESDSGTYLRVLCSRKQLISAILILADLVNLTPAERAYLLAGVPEPAKTANRRRS